MESESLNSDSKAELSAVAANKIKVTPKSSNSSTGLHTNNCNTTTGSIKKGDSYTIPCAYKTTTSLKKSPIVARKLWLRMSDVFVSVIILLTISIGFWRGVWQISDYYCTEYESSPWVSFVVCNVVLVLLYFYQETLRKYVHPNHMNFLLFYVISRFILLLHAFAIINQWRALWVFLDEKYDHELDASTLTSIIPILIAIVLKIFSNFLATPLYVGIDDAHTIHSCPLRFNTPPEKTFRYFWDCLFTVVVVQTLIIFSWRGLWCLADIYIYPNDVLSSAVVSWVIGNFIVGALCAVQPFYYKWVSKMKGVSRLAVMNSVTLIGFVGCVLGWRGCWELFNELLVFETKLTSEWVSTVFGALGAMILGCLSTVVNRGALIDGDLSDDSTEWSVSYISLLQERDFTVPFPEPWILRYFCTSQKMNITQKRRKIGRSDQHMVENGQCLKPLNQPKVNQGPELC